MAPDRAVFLSRLINIAALLGLIGVLARGQVPIQLFLGDVGHGHGGRVDHVGHAFAADNGKCRVHVVGTPRKLLQHRTRFGVINGFTKNCAGNIDGGVASNHHGVCAYVALSNELRFCVSQSLHVRKRGFALQRRLI